MKAFKCVIGAVLAASALHAYAQGYPNRPVHVVVSFTAGSSTDIVARVVAQKLSEVWGQPVVVENRAGAGGSIGSAYVVKQPADGYVLLVDSNAHTVTPSIYAKLPYDVSKDFTDIAPLALQPNVLVVPVNSKYKSLMDIVNDAKSRPSAINWGHAGVGSGTHLNTEKFIAAAKIKVTEIPFKGTPEVVSAMLSGSVDCYWAPISAALSLIKGGKLRPLAVSTPKRNGTLPDVPTTGEAGVQGADAPLWFALWGPAGMPSDIVNKISTDTRKALKDKAVHDRLVQLGNDPMDMAPDEFKKFVHSEVVEYARVVKNAGIKPQ
jgi:tripartite-type tricarboxylate transporter receptor subunit TctC